MEMGRYCLLRKESTYGQWDVSGLASSLRILSESLKLDTGLTYHRTVEGGRLLQTKQLNRKNVEGSLELHPVYDKGLGELLLMCLGSVSSVQQGGSTAYRHTFTPKASIKTSAWPSYSIEVGLDDVASKRVVGAVVESLAFDVEAGDFLGLTPEIYASDESKVTLGTVGTLSTLDYIHAGDVVTQSVDGSPVKLEHFSLEVKNNFPEGYQFGSRKPQQIDVGPLEVTGEMAIRFLSATHLDDFLASNEKAVAVKFQGPTISGSYKYELELDLPRVVYDAGDANLKEQERLVQSLKFTALEHSSNGLIKVYLQNTVTSY